MIGGLKFYFVAKHYDRKGGSGLIHERDFKKYFFQTIRLSRATYYRWKKQARNIGLFEDHGKVLQLVSWGRAALNVGCRRPKPVEVGLRGFVDNQGLSEVWAGYLKQYEPKEATEKAPAQKEKPITKPTLRKLTGIPESTQRYYEAKAGVEKTPNVANLGNPENPPAEETGGFYAKNGGWRRRLGNTNHTPKRIKKCRPGRTSKIHRSIDATLSPMSGSEQVDRSQKLFFHWMIKSKADPKNGRVITKKTSPDQQIAKYMRSKLPKIDIQKRPAYLYAYERTHLGFGIWTAWDTATGACV